MPLLLLQHPSCDLHDRRRNGVHRVLYVDSPVLWASALLFLLLNVNGELVPNLLFASKGEVLDLRSSTWSKIEAKAGVESSVDSSSSATITPCAGHSLVCIEKVPFLFEKLQTSLSAIFNVVILVDSTSSGIVWILMMETLS
ncbi:hypothetical protein RIF29_25931 [Crotalaria pallida]|uniref:Uncharacterized protein n=1 Tax=Crotalaria pallida TaxID=3830 RepID=A0AAN9EMT5_CROPI